MNQTKIIQTLIKRGNDLFNLPYKSVKFTGNPEADGLLNDLENMPHAFVLACVMDRQIKAERAWLISCLISQEIGGFEFERLLGIDIVNLKNIFYKKSLHRFNNVMADNFYSAIQLVNSRYSKDASNVWEENQMSASIVRRFLEFKGVGIKIATMATNILARDFKIKMKDRTCIDISPDVQVKRVFYRLGLTSNVDDNEELIYTAREFNPSYPGIFDLSAWEIGRKWCRPKNPGCVGCYLDNFCQKNI